MQAIKQEKNSVFSILWYRGSDAEYDYFSHVYSMTGTKNFKVPIGELILPRIEFTDDYQKWFLIKEIEGLWSASTLGADDKWKPDTEGVSIQFINQNGTVSPPN